MHFMFRWYGQESSYEDIIRLQGQVAVVFSVELSGTFLGVEAGRNVCLLKLFYHYISRNWYRHGCLNL